MKVAIYTGIENLPDWCNLIIQSVRKEYGNENIYIKFDDVSAVDLILNLSKDAVPDELLSKSIYGVLEIQYLGKSIWNSRIGLYEVLHKKEVIEIETVLIKNDDTIPIIVERAYYNPHWAYWRCEKTILDHIYLIVSKSIILISTNNALSLPVSKAVNFSPNLLDTCCYGFCVAKHLVKKIIIRLLGIQNQIWNVCVGTGNFLEQDRIAIFSNIKHNKKMFCADPFLFEYQGELYVFFERYSKNRGIISVGKVKNNQVINIIDVLSLDYHLSYPFIFSENGEIFMIPECSECQRIEVYKCMEFPHKWELYSTAFEGEGIVDINYYVDFDNKKWLFFSKSSHCNGSDLYIYRIDSLKFKRLEAHKMNPVIIDSRVARNGGAIFNYQGKAYRPSQCSSLGIYGRGLCINEIKKLTMDEYEEHKIMEIFPEKYSKFKGIHHLHQIDDKFVFDVCFRQLNNKI